MDLEDFQAESPELDDAQHEALLTSYHDEEERSAPFFDGIGPELRSASMETELRGNGFVGYAAVYGAVADLGQWTEESARGAFRKVLAQQQEPIPFLYDHKGDPLAHTGAGTLKLGDDTRGLHVEVPELPKHHPQVAMLREQIERGEVRHMSYGFVAGRGNSKLEQRAGKPHRIITGYNALLDVSPTWRPAFTATSAELRSQFLADIPDLSQQTDRGAHQQPVDGATEDPEVDATSDATEHEQRSGADWQIAAAARKRRLHMMGLRLPKQL